MPEGYRKVRSCIHPCLPPGRASNIIGWDCFRLALTIGPQRRHLLVVLLIMKQFQSRVRGWTLCSTLLIRISIDLSTTQGRLCASVRSVRPLQTKLVVQSCMDPRPTNILRYNARNNQQRSTPLSSWNGHGCDLRSWQKCKDHLEIPK